MNNQSAHKLFLRFSHFGILCATLFCVISLIARFLLPFGDEPDFTIRAPRVINGEHPFWSPFYIFESIYSNLTYNSDCLIQASPFSLFASIAPTVCSEPLEQVLIRWMLIVVITLPLLLFIVFSVLGTDFGIEERKKKAAAGLSLLFPGTVYYLGVFAEEQWSLVLSLLIFLCWRSKLLVSTLLILIALVDIGNSIVVFGFVFSTWFYVWISRKISTSLTLYIMIAQVVVAFVLGFKVLEYATNIGFIANKSQAMFDLLAYGDLVDKYPVILRPIITFMSFVFLTPAYVKAPILYVCIGFAGVGGLLSLFYKRKVLWSEKFNESLIQCMAGLSCIVSFVFLFPNYNNSKYYIFILPFFLNFLLYKFNKKGMLVFFISMDFLLFLHLIAYRI